MSDRDSPKAATRLLQPAAHVPSGFESPSVAVHRGSTVLFPDAAAFAARASRLYDGYTYGLYGTPTAEALARKLADIEDARRVILAPSGLAAIHLVNLAVLRAGDHMLLGDSMYGPTRNAARDLLGGLGIEAEFYAPGTGAAIAKRLRKNTKLLWIECPGSITMEMEDFPAMARIAREAGVCVAMDNTWATPLRLRPLEHGIDFSVQALTKFVAGHADVLMGSVAVNDQALFRRLRDVQGLIGTNTSPDDCSLVLRGMETLAVRLERQAASAVTVAQWLASQPAVDAVLFPALASDPGHALWKRHCDGAGAVFSFRLRANTWDALRAFADALRIFRLGASWGGVHSLVAVYPSLPARNTSEMKPGPIARLSIGLEDPGDLIDDLRCALPARQPMRKKARP